MKRCPDCSRSLPLSCFGKDAHRRDGRNNRCRECDSARALAYYHANRDQQVVRRAELRKRKPPRPVKPRPCKRCGGQVFHRRHWYCSDCRSWYEAKRRRARGQDRRPNRDAIYGPEHRKLRKEWAARVATGTVVCANPRCGRLIDPREIWDLGHVPGSTEVYRGPEHAACNRATAAQKSERRVLSRSW